eukprot:31348-Pelagococcus_subviridis.AAC.2
MRRRTSPLQPNPAAQPVLKIVVVVVFIHPSVLRPPSRHAGPPVSPGLGGCKNEKKPFSFALSSMKRSSGTRTALCAPMHSSATPIADNITLPAEDMKNTARMDAPDMPRNFSRSDTGRSPIFNGSVRTM